jgi:hypothetical protein
MEKLTGGWQIRGVFQYLLLVILCQFAIRLLSSVLRAIELQSESESFLTLAKYNFLGIHPKDNEKIRSDFWFSSILGLLELGTFPILMAVGAWNVIGAWIGLKTVAQWNHWKDNRASFNRYLIGNALVVIVSLLILVPYIIVK